MKTFELSKMKGGWFIGDFIPTMNRTTAFEVGVKFHKQDEEWPRHAQKVATEYNVLISGVLELEFKDGSTKLIMPKQGFVIEPKEVIKPHFLTDCVVVVVKIPSLPGDKYTC